MKPVHLLLALVLTAAALPQAAAAQARQRDDIAPVDVSASDPAVEAAKAEARRTLPQFLERLASPPPGTRSYQIKFPLAGWEFIWVGNLKREGTVLVGTLSNYPEQPGYQLGQTVRVPIRDVADWGYFDARGVMQGHFTTRALLSKLPPDEAAQVRTALGWSE